MLFGKRRCFPRIVGYESGLYKVMLTILSEDCINKFTYTHCTVNLDIELLTHLSELLFTHSGHIDTCILLNGIKHREPAVRTFELYFISRDGQESLAVDCNCNPFKQLLNKIHHPNIILVRHIDLHAGKFRIVCLIHSLISEVLCKFIYSRETTDYKSLEIEFVGNSQIEGNVKCIVMGDKGTCSSTTGNRL